MDDYMLCIPREAGPPLAPYKEFFLLLSLFMVGFLLAFLFITRRPRSATRQQSAARPPKDGP